MDGNKRGLYDSKRWEELLGHRPGLASTGQTKVSFPRFAGDDLRGWLYRSEAFFERNETPWDMKVMVAAVHLEGQALQWHQVFMLKRMTRETPRWEEYVQALHTRFGVTVFMDSMAERVTWRQIDREESWETFDLLAACERSSHASKTPHNKLLNRLVASERSSSSSVSLFGLASQSRGYAAEAQPAVFVDESTRVICQGITGKNGTFYTEQTIEYGTNMVGDVTSEMGGTEHLGLPVFNSLAEAKAETKAKESAIYVPPPLATAAIMEAIEAEVDLVIDITDGTPQPDLEFPRTYYEISHEVDIDVLEENIRVMLQTGTIQPSNSLYCFLVVLEKKKDRPGWLQPYRQHTLLMQNYSKPTSLNYGPCLMLSQFESARIEMLEFSDFIEDIVYCTELELAHGAVDATLHMIPHVSKSAKFRCNRHDSVCSWA